MKFNFLSERTKKRKKHSHLISWGQSFDSEKCFYRLHLTIIAYYFGTYWMIWLLSVNLLVWLWSSGSSLDLLSLFSTWTSSINLTWAELSRARTERDGATKRSQSRLVNPERADRSRVLTHSERSSRSPSISHVVTFARSGELFSSELRFRDKERVKQPESRELLIKAAEFTSDL